MLRALLSSFVLTLALLLAACGGGSGGDAASAPPSATASSNVVKGLIRNGVVTAWRWSEGAYVLVGSARTGENGDFSLAVQDPVPGEVLRLALDVSGDTRPGYRTEMLCDVAQCGSGVRGDWVPLTTGLGLTSWISVGGDGTLTVMPMTPVSTMLVRYAEDLGGGHLTAPTLEVARQRIAGLFKMTPEQLLVRPGNIANALWLDVASPEAIKVSLLSAAFAELSTASGYSIEQVLQHVATTFSQYDGHLMQDGETGSLGDVYRAMGAIIAAAGAPAVQSWVQDWITGVTAALQSDQLTTSACAPDCQPFDSNVFLEALGTGSDTLGGDLRRVMDEKGVETLEQLLAGELSRYGWLLSADSIALAQSAMQVVGASALSVLGMPLGAPAGLTLVREGDVLRFDGTINGLAIDLDVTLPPLLDTIQAYEPGATMAFVFGAQGTLQNERLRASINGTLAIDATGTDFAPLRDAIAAYVMASMGDDPNAVMLAQAGLLQAVGGILRAGQAKFTLDGSAGVARLELQGDALVETSRLAVAGKAGLQVDMDGLAGGGVKASGQVDHGSLELPNGDTFTVDPEQGHYLRFALAQHGTAELNIGVHILGHDATVSGSGTLAALGPLLSHLKDGIADQLQALTLDFTALATQFLTDARALALTVSGQAVIPDFDHAYTLTLANGVLAISQPDSSEVALQVVFSSRGLVASAGGKWWMVSVDLSVPGMPALLLSDSSGGEWRRDFDFSGVTGVAAL